MTVLYAAPRVRSDDDEPQLIPSYRHRASDYLDAALPHGLVPRRCAEPRTSRGGEVGALVEEIDPGPWDSWPWSLLELAPSAAAGAFGGVPLLMMWHFEKAG